MSTLVVMVVVGLGSYLIRISMVVGASRLAENVWLQRRLRLVAPSVLAALFSSSLFVSKRTLEWPGALAVCAVALGGAAVWRTNKLGAALGVGLPVYWVGAMVGVG
jgi:branched-subunit amino acid transport protein